MDSNNDARILILKEQIRRERDRIAEAKRFTPATTCIYTFPNNTKLSLRALTEDELIQLLIIVNALKASAEKLNYPDARFQGFTLEEWEYDIAGCLEQRHLHERKAKLARYEKQLDSLLSDDKKTELELNAIAKDLLTEMHKNEEAEG